MGNRTSTQIRDHYYRGTKLRGTCPGPFSPEEDALLIALHQKFGAKWYIIKKYFLRRTDEQIIERFHNVLRPNKKSGPWSQDEDRQLITMIRKYGYGQWTKISQHIFGRNDSQCLQRARRLLNWSVELHSERGTGEYDIGVYNPELFANILRLPPKKRYLQQHRIAFAKIKPNREIALKRLLKALKIVVPEYAARIEDLNAIDVSWMNPEQLMKLSEELHANLPKIDNHKKDEFIRPVRYLTNRPPTRRIIESEDEENDEEDYFQTPQEEKIPDEVIDLVNSSLCAMFEMQANIKAHRIRKTQEIGIKHWAEMSLYAEYLYEQFHCKTSCDKEQEKVILEEVDYEESIQDIISHFIQPPVYDNQFITLVPNLTTMAGMETIEVTEDRLLGMSDCVCHSKMYIDYLCERRKSSPQCLKCLQKSGKITCSSTPEAVISKMKKKTFLLDNRLENSAYLEGASVERFTNSCVCKALADSKMSVQLLRKRFMSLFMWPALLSVTELNKEQESMISSKESEDPDYFSDADRIEVQRSKEFCQKKKRIARPEEQVTKKRKLTITESLLEPSQESGYSSLHE